MGDGDLHGNPGDTGKHLQNYNQPLYSQAIPGECYTHSRDLGGWDRLYDIVAGLIGDAGGADSLIKYDDYEASTDGIWLTSARR